MSTLLLRRVNQPWFYRLISYVWLGFTCYLLFKPDLGFDGYLLFAGEDKVAHLVLFLNLSFLLGLNFRFAAQYEVKKVMWLIALFGIGFAFLSELVQYFLPKRAMDLEDFIYDLAGLSLGILAFFLIEKRINPS